MHKAKVHKRHKSMAECWGWGPPSSTSPAFPFPVHAGLNFCFVLGFFAHCQTVTNVSLAHVKNFMHKLRTWSWSLSLHHVFSPISKLKPETYPKPPKNLTTWGDSDLYSTSLTSYAPSRFQTLLDLHLYK